jgi:N,N-dimethylformamidase
MGTWDASHGSGYNLMIDEQGALALQLGDGRHCQLISTNVPLLERHWYLVAASLDTTSGEAWIAQRSLVQYARDDSTAIGSAPLTVVPGIGGEFRLGAWHAHVAEGPHAGRTIAEGFYNGKLDAPLVAGRALSPAERDDIVQSAIPAELHDDVMAQWDFSRDIPSTRITDVSPHGRHGRLVNLPTRAMKGHNWDGSEYNWTHKPEHYGAIHFHDDDLYDCSWETDFAWTVPDHRRAVYIVPT